MDFLNNNFLVLYFQIFFFLVLGIYQYKKKKYLSISVILVGIYLYIALMSLLLFANPYSVNFFKELSFFPSIYFIILFLISTYPILSFNERKIQHILGVNHTYVYLFSSFIILVFAISVIDVVQNFNNLLFNLFFDADYGNELYLDSRTDNNAAGINYLAVIASASRDFPQFLLFYILTFKKKNKIIVRGLVIALLVSVLSGLVNGLRGNVAFVVLSSIFCFFVFKKFYSKKLLRIIKVFFITSAIGIAIPFFILSKSRFDTGYSSYKDSNFATLMYSGQSLLYFNNYAFDNNGLRYGDRTMNLFKGLLFDDVPKDQEKRSLKYNQLYISDEVFSTYLGDFVFDFGSIATLFLVTIFSFILALKTHFQKQIDLVKILFLYFIWNSLTFGVFLFPYSDISGNLRILLFLILIIFISVSKIKNNKKHNYG